MKRLVDVHEQYISPAVLPNEQASCWIKWKKGAPFDRIVLRHEADIEIQRLFNVDEGFDVEDGKITISKDMLQIDGFFGFAAVYTAIPDKDRRISYVIDIVSGDKIQTIDLDNTVARPKMQAVKATSDRIGMSKFMSDDPVFSKDERSLVHKITLSEDQRLF